VNRWETALEYIRANDAVRELSQIGYDVSQVEMDRLLRATEQYDMATRTERFEQEWERRSAWISSPR
jgi:hypothetical protein